MSATKSRQATFRSTQAPLKQSYRADPLSALVTLKSSGTLDNTSITCRLDGPNTSTTRDVHQKVAGLHPMAGGPGAELSGELCSGDMLLEALVGCAGVTLKAVATTLGIPLESGEVRAEADMDFRGTLGIDSNAPVGFTAIRLSFDLKMKAGEKVDHETLRLLGTMTERYCVVLQTIVNKPSLTVTVDGRSEMENGSESAASWVNRVDE